MKKEEFKDFQGNRYTLPDLDEGSKRDERYTLLNFSYNNRYFLFLDNSKGNEKLLMFELQILKEDNEDAQEKEKESSKKSGGKKTKSSAAQSEANQGYQYHYQFNLVYELNVGKSKMWKESL